MLDSFINFVDRVVQTITPVLNNIVAALMIIFIGFIVGKFVSGLLLKVLQDVRVDETGKKVLRRKVSFATTLSSFVKYVIYIASFILALNLIGATKFILLTLGIVFLVIVVISLLISLKDFIPNVVTGTRMRKMKKYAMGRSLTFKGVRGTIKERSLLQVRVERANGDVFILPNKLFKDKV